MAGQQMVALGNEGTPPLAAPLSPLAGGLVFAGYAAALLALCWLLFERRDA
jgi:ABC-type transport system involved in multi-copper enzyme maturation permease subunit